MRLDLKESRVGDCLKLSERERERGTGGGRGRGGDPTYTHL